MKIYFADDCIYVGGRLCRSLSLENGRSVRVCVMGERYYGTTIAWQDGTLSAAGFDVLRYPDCLVLRFRPKDAPYRVLAQQSLGYGAATVTVFAEAEHTTVWLEGVQTYCLYLPPLVDATIVYSPSLRAVGVWGTLAAVASPNPLWGLLVSASGEVLFEGAGTAFSLAEQWVVDCSFVDMRRHARSTRYGYAGGSFCTLAHSIECASSHTYISTLLPYLFLEALVVGDQEEARSYLAPALAADWDALLAYLGPVATLLSPPYLLPDHEVCFADDQGVGKRFRFTLSDSLIDDVTRLDAE